MLDSWPVSLFGAPARDDAGFSEFMETTVGFTGYKEAGLSHQQRCDANGKEGISHAETCFRLVRFFDKTA
jgi:hypothetical protein